jgi:hypothetical protein
MRVTRFTPRVTILMMIFYHRELVDVATTSTRGSGCAIGNWCCGTALWGR